MKQFFIRCSQIIGDLVFKLKKTSAWILFTKKMYLSLFLASLFSSCLKDNFDFDKMKDGGWSPELAMPLAHTSMSIQDLMRSESDSGNLVMDSSMFCTLIYTGNATRISSNELISLPDQSFQATAQLTSALANLINTQGSLSVSFEQVLDLSFPGGIALDSMTYKNGQMWMNMNMRIPADVQLTISIPSATLNGVPYTASHLFHYTGTLPVTQNVAVDLSGYKFDLSDNGASKNKLRIKFDFDITHTGTAITSNHRLNMNCNLNGYNFSSIYGYFGQQAFMSDYDTINITLFNHLDAFSSFTIAKPEVKISFNNSIGVPVRANVVNMKGVDGDFSDLIVAQGFPNPLPVVSPNFNQIGQTLSGEFIMNSTNSNVKQLIAAKPKYLMTRIESTINPNGNTGMNFMTDSSKIDIDVEVKLPLHGTAENFVLRDTVDFNYNHLQNVQSMTLRTLLKNGFPFDANWQIYFADYNYQVLDSLVTTGNLFMPSAIVNLNNGKVKEPSTAMHDNTLDRNRIVKIMNAKYMIIKANAATYQNGSVNVKIYGDYKFEVNIGVIAKVNL